MANGGWYGTQEEWDRLQAPLLSVDSVVGRFAAAHGLDLTKNHKDRPERSMRWGSDPACLIQLFLADEAKPSWNFWIVCSQDRYLNRYWKQAMVVSDQPLEAFRERLPNLLDEAFSTVEAWRHHPEEFELAGPIQPLP